jgi:hypothetical protein
LAAIVADGVTSPLNVEGGQAPVTLDAYGAAILSWSPD